MSSTGFPRVPVWAIVGLLVVSALVASTAALGMAPASAHIPTARASVASASPFAPMVGVSNGDITINGPSESLVIQHNVTNGGMFPMGGNITVLNHGTLTFIGMTVLFEQFTATNTSNWAADLHYRYHISLFNGGRLWLENSTITSDPNTQDTYLMLNVSVGNNSVLAAEGSQLNFPGSIDIYNSSSLFMNQSVLQADQILPSNKLAANFTAENSFAASLRVDNDSEVVSTNSQFLDTYADADTAMPAEVDENFAAAGPQILNFTGGAATTFADFIPATALDLDLGSPWSSGAIEVSYENPTATAATAAVTFTPFGTPISVGTATFQNKTNATISLPLSALTLTGTLNHAGLAGVLEAMQAHTLQAAVGPSTVAGVEVTQVALSLTPATEYNITFSKSTLAAVNTLFDVNYNQPPDSTCASVQPYTSNKMDLTDGSQGFLLNSTSTTFFQNGTGQCPDVAAFVPDATSQIMTYGWAAVNVESGTNAVEDAAITVSSAVSSTTNAFVNTTANTYSSANYLSHHQPDFFTALVGAAMAAEGGASYHYGNTSNQGVAYIALATNLVNNANLPSGNFIGDYNLRSSELATELNNTQVPAYSHTSTPGMCSWPTIASCPSPVPTVPIQMPLLSAELVITSSSVDNVMATNPTCVVLSVACQVYESNTVGMNITVHDVNSYKILAGNSIPVAVYDGYSGTSGPAYNQTYFGSISNTDLANGGGSYELSITFPVPLASAGSHDLFAVVDPSNAIPMTIAPGNQVNVSTSFLALGIPIFTTSGIAVTAWDACTTLQVTANVPNTCNSILLKAAVTNEGDVAADSVDVTFAINGVQVNTTQDFPVIGSLGVGTAVVGAIVTPGDSPLGNITASVAWSSVTPINPPAPENVIGFAQIPFTDYTQIELNAAKTTITTLTSAGTSVSKNLVLNLQGTSQAQTRIGSWFGVSTEFNNTGGPATNARASVEISIPGKGGVSNWVKVSNETFPSSASGTVPQGVVNESYEIGWHVNASVIKTLVGPREFALYIAWDDGNHALNISWTFVVNVQPAPLSITGVKFTPATVTLSSLTGSLPPTYDFGGGTVSYLDGPATGQDLISLNISFVSTNGVYNESLAADLSEAYYASLANGTNLAQVTFTAPIDLTPGTYNIVIEASFAGAQTWSTVQGALTVTSNPTTTNWYDNPLYLILIAAIVIVAIVVVLLVLRGAGKGKLVECGECGELIPESAAACPRCGAEFETEMVRCSRCGSTIPAASNVCPECSVTLLGKEDDAAAKDPQRSAYEDFTQKYRGEAKRELGENYSEGSFWDWWKRQPTFLSFSAWKMQQSQGTRVGMTVPTGDREDEQAGPNAPGAGWNQPPRGGAGGGGAAPAAPAPRAAPGVRSGAPPQARAAPQASYPAAAAPAAAAPMGAAAPASGGMKTCSSCGREINADFLVCPFCSAVTR